MGEFSDCGSSWHKLVLSKSDQWTSTVKSECTDPDYAGSTSSGDYAEDQVPKSECEFRDVSAYDDNEEAVRMIQEVNPLYIDSSLLRRPRGSGAKSETTEMRASRLAKMSAYAATRLANETPEQRAVRLKRMSEYAAKRLARETSEQRAKRLARMSEYAAKRLASETPEQRSARLARMSAYAAKRQAMKKKIASTITVDLQSPHPQNILPYQS